MGLSRLSNFLKNVKGNIIYVDPNSLDSTDSVENQGNSLTRPFKTIQRALIEAARFSYQRGKKNDRFLKTTILLYPGDHYVDNRPGFIPIGQDTFLTRGGLELRQVIEWDFQSNFDIFDAANDLYRVNSIYGGVIVPRGTSIVGLDLRKTKVRPLYVPNPENDDIERSALFRVTGGCYFWQFTILDGDPNGLVYRDYTSNLTVPNYSHHKLTVFEYADGLNPTKIEDEFVPTTDPFFGVYETERSDLDMYYQKIGLIYGAGVGRPISPDYPSVDVDIEPVVDEYRVVGSKGLTVGISTIQSGNGIVGSTEITVFLGEKVEELSVDTPIQISGVAELPYSGQFAVSEVIDDFTFKYTVGSVPAVVAPNASGATVSITVDTVSSASPYVFNCSLRSVFGMCGLHADGSKATGFRSMVVAQFTGIGLQKDDQAFCKYDEELGVYNIGAENGHTDSLSRFRPTYENYHIKGSNNAFLQLVSVFAIGFANHFLAESGGDHSITNSNSNFGAKSLVSKGFREEAFIRDDCGYITNVITPKTINSSEETISYLSLDINRILDIGNQTRLYLADELDEDNPPINIINGYRIGASEDDKLFVDITDPDGGQTDTYSATIVMGGTEQNAANPPNVPPQFNIRSEKRYRVGRSLAGISSIRTDGTIEFDSEHTFTQGESVIPIPIDGNLPDGLETNVVYFVNTDVSDLDREIRLARSFDDAVNNERIVIPNNRGGIVEFVSRVVDKAPGQKGSPLQYDRTLSTIDGVPNQVGGWYLSVDPFNDGGNAIYDKLLAIETAGDPLPNVTTKSYIKRIEDDRSEDDKIYKLRYILPKDNVLTCRPPIDGYVLQNSSDTNAADAAELAKYFPLGSQEITNPTDVRNFRFISNAEWSTNLATITTELPHDLSVGDTVSIYNINSDSNESATFGLGFNGNYVVLDTVNSRTFTYFLSIDPGGFNNDTNTRTPSGLPRFSRRRLKTTYQVFRSEEIQPYKKNQQDGIYHLTVINSSNNPTVAPFNDLSFAQPIQNLYPQLSRDTPRANPSKSFSVALPDPIGEVVVNDPRLSITRETVEKSIRDFKLGFEVADIQSSTASSHVIKTKVDHGLSGIRNITVTNPGIIQTYQSGVYYNVELVGAAGSTTGLNATSVVEINTAGQIESIIVQNPGSAYGIGNTLTLVGITTGSAYDPSTQARLRVDGVFDESGKVISVSGISSHKQSISNYNGDYVITGIDNGGHNDINVISTKNVDLFTSTILGSTDESFGAIVGEQLDVNSLTYDPISGVGTVGFTTTSSFRLGSNIKLYGATDSFFNNKDNFVVINKNSSTSVRVNFGKSDTTPLTTGTIKAIPTLLEANSSETKGQDEFTSSRLIYSYGNISKYVQTELQVTGSEDLELYDTVGLNIGDYLLVNDEIMRIDETIIAGSTQVSVSRALLGTRRQLHAVNSLVTRINVLPVELRRNSIIRASGHTFEYLGFGPGNYSTGLPERQDRVLSAKEEILSQATKVDGGTIQYTGMNSDGDFYNNNRKLTSTGKDQIFEAPIPTVTAEEPLELFTEGGYNLSTPEEIIVNRSIKVNGGDNNKLISQFNGPTIFNERITSTSPEGITLRNFNIKGNLDISREFSIDNKLPTNNANLGDVVFNGSPIIGENAGWIYAKDPDDDSVLKWAKYGWVNDSLYGVDVTTSTIANKKLTRVIDFEGEGVNILSNYDASSGVTTISIEQSSEALNQVGIITGVADSSQAFVVDDTGIKFETTITDSGSVPGEVNAPIIKFSGSNLGFGVRLNAIYPPSSLAPGFVGVTTIEYQSPIFPINFGTNSDLPGDGSGAPVFSATPAGRTDGTRVIYRETIGSASVDFAKGLVNNILWESVAQNSGNYGWHYYAGETLISRFSNSNTFDSESYSGSNSNFKWNYIFGFNDAGGDGARVDIETNGIVKARVLESFAPNGEAPFTLDSITETPFLNAAVVSRAGGIPCRPDVNNVVTVNVNVPGGTVQAYNTIPVRQVNGDGQVFINANSTGLLTDEGGTITGRPGEYFLNEINSLAGVTFNTTSGASVTGVSTFFAISDVVLPNATSFLAGDNTLSDGDLFIDSGAITVNFLKGPVCRIDGPTTATLLSIVNVPTLPNRTYNYTVIINSSTSTSVPYQLQVNGTTITPSSAIQWLNGESPESGGGVGTFLVGFTFLCDNNGDFNSTSTEAGRGTRVLGVFGSYTGS